MGDLQGWTERQWPERLTHIGRFVRLEPLDATRHAKALGAALTAPGMAAQYEFLPDPPPNNPADVRAWVATAAQSADPFYYAVIDKRTGKPEGWVSLRRIEPKHGVVAIGHVLYSLAIQRSPVTTEVILLLGRYVFETLGYRRFEWRSDSLNERSRRAALRFGFTFEGIFRQDMVVKGRNRDTAWFSMLDGEWPARRRALEAWLAPENFDEADRQRQPLSRFQDG
jgi:RimJ/RimL family protein N-acetyltransferase